MKHKIITCADGQKIRRLSRWIKVQTAYNITSKSCLYDFAENDGEGGNICSYFVFKGQKYALGRFTRIGSPWFPCSYSWHDKDGKLQFLSGADCTEFWNPYLIELDECAEYVRVYEEINE